jgi:hypothetical protein
MSVTAVFLTGWSLITIAFKSIERLDYGSKVNRAN